jgi:hypothetical protein
MPDITNERVRASMVMKSPARRRAEARLEELLTEARSILAEFPDLRRNDLLADERGRSSGGDAKSSRRK